MQGGGIGTDGSWGSDSFMEAVSGLARAVADGLAISDVLHELVAGLSAFPALAGAGVSLRHDGRVWMATADVEALAGLERVQEDLQEGPCVDVALTGVMVTVEDLREDPRWPAYTEHALAHDVLAVAGVPMVHAGTAIGAVNLYSSAPRRWPPGDLFRARILADIATSHVSTSSERDEQRRIAEQLQQALDSRVVIEQAKGIIAASRHISVDEAFRILRKHANDHNADLRSAASAVVELGLRP